MGDLRCGESGQREREGFPSQGVTRPRSYQTKELLSNGVTKSRGYQACEPVCCLIVGEEIVRIIESTPLDDASDFEIDSDFMPILKEVRKKGVRGNAIHSRVQHQSVVAQEVPLPSFLFSRPPSDPLTLLPAALVGPGQGAQHHPRGHPGHRPR